MDSWTPEYRAWLASLKVGDTVAVKDLDLDPSRAYSYNRLYGYRCYSVAKITPKRTRIDCIYDNPASLISFSGDGFRSTGGGFLFLLEPLTPEVSQAVFDDQKWMRNVSTILNAKRQLEAMLEKIDSVPRDVVAHVAETAQLVVGELSTLE